MTRIGATTPSDAPVDGDLERARAGDDEAFARLVAPLRPELLAHCYRMLASNHDAEDALQNTLIQVWRGLASFEQRSSLRRWLYTVATRCCLDLGAARRRRALPVDLGPASPHVVADDAPRTEVAWLEPFADAHLAGAPARPDARYEQREAVELAFVAALQHLPGNQRAALLLFDVLGFSAAEIAATMQTTAASVNSALQRARATVAEKVPAPSQQKTLRMLGDARVRELVTGFSTALERGDADQLVALLSADVTWAMPPLPCWYAGRRTVEEFVRRVPLGDCGRWHALSVTANGQPGVALYLQPPGATRFSAWAVNVLGLADDRIAEVTTFIGLEHFAAFGLPPVAPHPEGS